MLPAIALGLALFQDEGAQYRANVFDGLMGPQSMRIATRMDRLKVPKRSPKQDWEFDWTTAGYVKAPTGAYKLRFNVFSQESNLTSARPESVTRTLLALFGYNLKRLGIDHADAFTNIVSVYLCYGGDPGGEQLFDVEKESRFAGNKVNTIYFYDLRSFTDPVETNREVAHEYGHATLPPINGFTEPEEWANGYLGEKLYMSYLAESRRNGTLTGQDTFGASDAALTAWVKKNVDPFVEEAALKGPHAFGKDRAGMDSFIGLALWFGKVHGGKAMVRALDLSRDSREFAKNAGIVAEERNAKVDVPASLDGKTVWIPVGRSKVTDADEIVKDRKDGWAHVKLRPGVKPLLIAPTRD